MRRLRKSVRNTEERRLLWRTTGMTRQRPFRFIWSGEAAFPAFPGSVRYGKIIRPLLCLTREEIEDFLKEEGISFRTDASNLETDYARNRIRLNILPLLREELNPRTCEHLAETAERLALAEDYLEAQAEEAVKKLIGRRKGRTEDGGTELLLERKGFLEEPEALKA